MPLARQTERETVEVENERCRYCGKPDARVLYSFHDAAVVRCLGCNMARTLPQPNFNYEDDIGYIIGDTSRDQRYGQYAARFLDVICRHTNTHDLLELGSNVGFLLEEAMRREIAARGIEPSKYAVQECHKRGLIVEQGTLETVVIEPASVDTVCMSHVLEHIPDLRSTFQSIRRVLRPGGYIAISEPLHTGLLPVLSGHLWYGWQLKQHIWHFDVVSITQLLKHEGFRRVAVEINTLDHRWLPSPITLRPKVLTVQVASALIARGAVSIGRGDQFYMIAQRSE